MLRTLALTVGLLAMISSLASEAGPTEIGRIEKAKSTFLIRDRRISQAKRGDTVLATDVITTDTSGGFILLLRDGSKIFSGGSVELRVAKQDVAAQQTLVELLHGTLRAEVKTVTRPGGVFGVRTPTAYVTALGTDVAIQADSSNLSSVISQEQIANLPLVGRDFTSLIQLVPAVTPEQSSGPTIRDYGLARGTLVDSLDGVSGVSGLEDNNPGTIYLLPNNFTDVEKGAAPSTPAPMFRLDNWQPTEDWSKILERYQPVVPAPQGSNEHSFLAPFDYYPCRTGYSPTGVALWKWDPNHIAPAGSAPFSLNINGNNISTGLALNIMIAAHSPCTIEVLFPSGTMFHPKGFIGHAVSSLLLGGNADLKKFQRETAFGLIIVVAPAEEPDWGGGTEGSAVTVPTRGFCVDLHKLPPHQKTEYRIASPSEQEKFSPDQPIIAQTIRMLHTGEITQGANSENDIIQWTLWIHIQHLSEKGFHEEFTRLVKANIEARKQKWDKDVQRTVDNLARDLWQKSEAILRATYK